MLRTTLTTESVQWMSESCKSLTELHLTFAYLISPLDLPKLSLVALSNSHITLQALDSLLKIPSIQSVYVEKGTSEVKGADYNGSTRKLYLHPDPLVKKDVPETYFQDISLEYVFS